MVSGVVEVVALLSSVKGGFRRSAARAVINQVTAAIEFSLRGFIVFAKNDFEIGYS